jgi:hypothetical protein
VNFFFGEGAVWLSNEATLVLALEKNCLAVLNEEGTIEGGRESWPCVESGVTISVNAE